MRRPTRRRLVLALAAACLAAGSAAYAQREEPRGRIWVGGGRYGYYRQPPKMAKESDFDGSFIYCRGFYRSRYREPGGQGWSTDYPGADNNFSVRLAELTRVHVRLDDERQPNYSVVSLTDPLLYHCPMLFMEDVGTAEFTDEEVRGLREFFLKGGFLWVDDYWGSYAWQNWVEQISRVLPPAEFPIFDIPRDASDHAHAVRREGGHAGVLDPVLEPGYANETSERGADSAQVHFRGIQDSHGRLMVVMTHNTDIADTWEREGENRQYFDLFSPRGYAIGVNVVLYAMTH